MRALAIGASASLTLIVAVLVLCALAFPVPKALAPYAALVRECPLFAGYALGDSKTLFRPGLTCIIGPIDNEAAQAVARTDIQDGSALVVRSMGGDAKAGLDIADVVLRKHLRVVVDQFCISACANYIFLAADRKIVLPGAWVGFHGTPLAGDPWKWTYIGPPELREHYHKIAEAGAAQYQADVLRRQKSLVDKTGTNLEITYKFPVGLDPKTFDFPNTFWEYDSQTMRDKFGVKGIDYMEPPAQTGWLGRTVNHLIGSYICTKVVSGAVVCRR